MVSRMFSVNCGILDLRASKMLQDFENSGHPVLQRISPLSRGKLKRKNDRNRIHFNGKFYNIDLLYKTAQSANQLCTNGAVTKW